MTTIKATVINRRIEIPAPNDIPDGAEILLTISESDHDLMSTAEIALILSVMQNIPLIDIFTHNAADLDEWDAKINQRGIGHCDLNMENVYP